MTDQDRIELALQCHDCRRISKVPNAGATVTSLEGDYQIMHNGLRLFCDSHYGSYNVEVIKRLRGHHEPQEEAVFHEVLKRIQPGSFILELGSFWAYYSLWFLDQVPQGRAILVEPVPSALEAGRRNFSLNRAHGDFINGAIGARPEASRSVELWQGMTVETTVLSVDSLMKERNIARLAVLHSDIQGNEIAMLQGAGASLTNRSIDWIFISTHEENIHQRCLQILRNFHYYIQVEHGPGESYSVDGLIVASANREEKIHGMSKRRTSRSMIARVRSTIRVRILEPVHLMPVTK